MKMWIMIWMLFLLGLNQTNAQLPVVGAARTWEYIKELRDKHIGLVVNQTSTIGNTHLVDSLLGLGIKVNTIFAPEHGFRGEADAGAHIANGKDRKTGTPIVSLYGKKHAPDSIDLVGIDVIVFDIQDVGCRFYTFISTLHYVMEACATHGKKLIVLDRPNPNGHYVDGPVLKKGYESFVGVDPIPIVHGLTVGEYAMMVKGENWIKNAASLDISIIKCNYYTHSMRYNLPIKPSPNLPNEKAIAWYPSICFFEGTNVSVGRGTAMPFQVIGSPYIDSSKMKFMFIPKPTAGASAPFLNGKKCYGYDLRMVTPKKLDLEPLIKMYKGFNDKSKFFLTNGFFDKLAGTDDLRKQIVAGKSANEIKISWEADLNQYKELRQKYLLYEL